MINKGIVDIHLASQYLAAAGISFLSPKEDDSHTNLGWSEVGSYYYSRPLNDQGDHLTLDLTDFSLRWESHDNSEGFELHNRLHSDILAWISDKAAEANMQQPYRYKFHYSLPYLISDNYKFEKQAGAIQKEIELRSLAPKVLDKILNEFGLDSEIRIWPHHFDTGAYASLPSDTNTSIGLGLAIPDSLIVDYYYYVAAYRNNGALPTGGLAALSNGQWLSQGFTGAVLPASDVPEKAIENFFREAISAYK